MSSAGVNRLRFNQDQSCFACATESGFRIYNVDPLTEKLYQGGEVVGGVGHVEMLHRTNLLALVGGGTYPKYADNSVLLWDDSRKETTEKLVCEVTCPQPVLAIRMRKDKLIVVLRREIHIFQIDGNVKHLKTIPTGDNPEGLCEVNPGLDRQTLVFPAQKKGKIQIVDLLTLEEEGSIHPVTLDAHENQLACLAINQQGSLVATASKSGTRIVIFDTLQRRRVLELRRGTDTAIFYCMNFSLDSAYLCASSDKGTVHIFAVKNTHLNRRSAFKKMGFLGSYGESMWSLANFTVPSECPCICAFASQHSVIAVCVDGTFHRYVFTQDGNCNREAYDVYLDISETMEF